MNIMCWMLAIFRANTFASLQYLQKEVIALATLLIQKITV